VLAMSVKIEYVEALEEQERLRLEHNAMGTLFRDEEITGAEWRAFLVGWNPRHLDNSKTVANKRAEVRETSVETQGPQSTTTVDFPPQIEIEEDKLAYLLVLGSKFDEDDNQELADSIVAEQKKIKNAIRARIALED